ncbi:MAG TPA: peptidoglycan DD-metalloendopeptidase family protein [Bdellovibrionales bacterium]|nr:peptidoglycan DD-metalloendopeptidase family protein [Bdellovibrionales bacterium]
MIFALLVSAAFAQSAPEIDSRIESARSSISTVEKQQREALSNLFVITKQIKTSAGKRAELNQRMLEREAGVRALAQEVQTLEAKKLAQTGRLNGRLRSLYQERKRDPFQWLFAAGTPIELERNHRFMKRMIDSDHRQLKRYIAHIRQLQRKREELKSLVAGLARSQKAVTAQEFELARMQVEKKRLVSRLKESKDVKLSELKELRGQQGDILTSYAFFEKKGRLRAPVDAKVVREYGAYVDPHFRFKLMHKGWFFGAGEGSPVHVVSDGRVALAGRLPGYGQAVIVDHGDNYFSVYAFMKNLKVREGAEVREGDVVAVSGGSSPLFGPGLYFEIRHFTDAIDPRQWIKDPGYKTAQNEESP